MGHRPSPFSLNNTPEITGLHNSPSKSCFSTPQEERRILISSSYSPYDLVSFSWVPKIRFYLPKAHPWRFSAQSVPLFNFGDSLVPHVQRQDGNLPVDGFSWYTSGKSPARNFRALKSILFHLQQLHYSRTRTLNFALSLSLSLSRASTNTKTLSEDHFSNL